MKKIVLLFEAVLLFAACGGNVNGKIDKLNNLVLDSISDSVTIKVGDCSIITEAHITYPVEVEPIKQDLIQVVKLIGQGEYFEGYPDSIKIDTTDMRSVVNYLLNSKAQWLKDDYVEGIDNNSLLSYSIDMNVMEETEKYITMSVYEELLFSGPHPVYTSYGITYLKPDGKKVGVSDLEPSKIVEIKNDLKTKVEDFFRELVKDDDIDIEQLLYGNEDEDKGQIDMPEHGFYLFGDSLVFAYQIDELLPYAFGMPDVRMSMSQMKENGWLGKELGDIVK